jgi:hypothetical protein
MFWHILVIFCRGWKNNTNLRSHSANMVVYRPVYAINFPSVRSLSAATFFGFLESNLFIYLIPLHASHLLLRADIRVEEGTRGCEHHCSDNHTNPVLASLGNEMSERKQQQQQKNEWNVCSINDGRRNV